jgi:hypothetical protein
VTLTLSEGTAWEEKKAKQLSVNVPSGRIVSRVQVELTTVKICVYESETPSVQFVFAETNSNDPNPLMSTILLSDNCECNVCPESKEGLGVECFGEAVERIQRVYSRSAFSRRKQYSLHPESDHKIPF